MSIIQKILLAAACILYAVTIYGFFHFDEMVLVVFFMMHSLCLLVFCYRTYSEVKTGETESDTRQQEIGLQFAERDKEIANLQSLLTEKENQFLSLSRESDVLKFDMEKLEQTNKELKEELAKKEEESTVKNEPAVVLSSLLPPPDDPDSTEPSIVNIVELANAARNELMESAKKANLHVSVSCIQETLLVRADANRLKVLFKNIIDNSIKYMNKPGSLVITISSLGDDIFIVLKDTGEGLAQKETKHIFELNYQGSNRLSGNGLGLAQAKAIVEYYGGTIYAKSTVGGGMGIYIQLPA